MPKKTPHYQKHLLLDDKLGWSTFFKGEWSKIDFKRGENILLIVLKDTFRSQASCCVSIQGLHPLIAAFEGQLCLLRRMKTVLIRRLLQMQPTNAAFFSLFLEDAGLMASHIPRFFTRPKKKKERKWRGVDRLVMQSGSAPKARLSHLTTTDAG